MKPWWKCVCVRQPLFTLNVDPYGMNNEKHGYNFLKNKFASDNMRFFDHILVVQGGFTVTFTYVLIMYLYWICFFCYSPLYYYPFLRTISTGLIFLFSSKCVNHSCPLSPSHLPLPFPLVTTSRQDLFYLPAPHCFKHMIVKWVFAMVFCTGIYWTFIRLTLSITDSFSNALLSY
jgi:hypothetical protein